MKKIGSTLISDDLGSKHFVCDLAKCKGACCVKGDSGAPLTDEETEILNTIFADIKSYLREEGIKAIEVQGAWVIDSDGDKVTPLVDNKECAYVVFEKGIAFCGIEKAFLAGATDFRKPVSCHLYPVRVKVFRDFTAINYDQWEICDPARVKGLNQKVTVQEFVKEALIRRFGQDWYNKLKSCK
jgi:Fe-S-cluster containining protein